MNSTEENFGKIIKEFEIKYAEELLQFEANGFLTWALIKNNLFYHYFLKSKQSNENLTSNKNKFNLFYSKSKEAFSFIFFLVKHAFVKNKVDILFFAYGNTRRHLNQDNKLMNIWLDGLIEENIVQNYLFVEVQETKITNSFIPPKSTFNAISLLSAASFYKQFLKLFHGKYISKESKKISKFIENNNSKLAYHTSIIEDTLLSFFAEKKMFELLLSVIKPNNTVSFDRLNTGFIGACVSKKIKAIDLQHGLIGQFYPSYNFTEKFKDVKIKMAIPNYIGVFGALEKEELLLNNFWVDEELHILGSYNFFLQKNVKINLCATKKIVLLTENINHELLLETIEKLIENNIYFDIRFHPSESNYVKQLVNNLVYNYESIAIVKNDENLYSTIKNAKLVIGFFSTVLLESLAIGVPVISVITNQLDIGILKYYRNKILAEKVIISPVNLLVENISKIFKSRLKQMNDSYIIDNNYLEKNIYFFLKYLKNNNE